ncbi:MAG: hypothetical protein RIQ33_329 [Bacteroidota bacterium]|jgi:hypothetical protein
MKLVKFDNPFFIQHHIFFYTFRFIVFESILLFQIKNNWKRNFNINRLIV